MVNQGRPSPLRPTSWMPTMFGCRSRAMVRVSFSKRRRLTST
jgi:hypothetical protein